MFRINRRLLPIKAHYLFFMAAMGPILPQLSVIGKQIGIAPQVMGYITSVLPIMYVLAKPMFGFIADYFSHFRKSIFIGLIALMTLSYGGFYFVPMQPHVSYITEHNLVNVTLESTHIEPCGGEVLAPGALCTASSLAHCSNDEVSFVAYFTDTLVAGQETLRSNINDTLPNIYVCQSPIDASNTSLSEYLFTGDCNFMDPPIDCTYSSSAFWLFVVLMCAGTIGFNVVNSISDAICFDMLGESEEDKYGAQRVWGTIGFGASALLAGVVVDLWTVEAIKSFTPALLIMAIFSVCDLLSVAKLKLPKLYASDSIFNDVWDLLCHPSIAIFLVFATIAGIIDSFIIYFMFWHVEEVAAETGYMEQIKLIEGCVVAAECLAGEVPFFFFSGKIIKKLGYVHCMSLCFFFYAVRLALISWIPNPWYLVGVELFFQGCTYALCYTCIVAYASAVAPPGTSATVQGIMAGMDDGLGFSIGSLIGGLAFKNFGGRRSFKYFAVAAIITCIAHIVIRPSSRKKQYLPKSAAGGYQVPAEQEMQVIGVDENKA